jgi:hypothetical protein
MRGLIVVCVMATALFQGCAATRLDREATKEDRATCEQATAGYWGSAAWMVAYRDCLIAKGYK